MDDSNASLLSVSYTPSYKFEFISISALLLKLKTYSRLSLSRNRRDPLKHFDISVFRHIRFVVLRKKQLELPNFTNDYVIGLLKLEIYMENIWKRGEIAPQEQFLLFSTIFCNLILDLCVKTRTRFSFRDKQVFEITEAEITRVDCIKTLKTGRTAGPDSNENRLLKELARPLSALLIDRVNCSLLNGKIPTLWKEANVTPAFKKNDPSDVSKLSTYISSQYHR